MSKKKGQKNGLQLEAVDRAWVALDHFESYVADHSIVKNNKAHKKKAEKIIDLMYRLYNSIATEPKK